MVDTLIIGGGIVGTCIARELSRYEGTVLIVEKENDVANHQTIANSAIIHSGHDPIPKTLKARLCVEGNAMYELMEQQLHIPILRTGAYVVATTSEEEEILKVLLERSIENGVLGATLLDAKQARVLEPNLSLQTQKVLSLPSTKVTFPWEVAIRAMQNAIRNGAEFRKNTQVSSIRKIDNGFEVATTNGEIILAKHVVNAAGVYSGVVAGMIEKNVPYTITPRRGEYFVLDRRVKGFVQHVLYPVPTKAGKGVLVVPQTHGNILLGPTSTHQEEPERVGTTREGLDYIRKQAVKLAENIPFDQIIRSFSGIRATSTAEDFYIKESNEVKGFFHAGGIDSPGLTAAPAIAKCMVEEVMGGSISLRKKTYFDPIEPEKKAFHDLPDDEKKALLRRDPRYGNIVCKCEKITEAEVIEAIHGPLGSDTIKGIKKRARVGSGICQGGYCEETLLKIIARETKKRLDEINYYALNTPILIEETKVKR